MILLAAGVFAVTKGLPRPEAKTFDCGLQAQNRVAAANRRELKRQRSSSSPANHTYPIDIATPTLYID